MEFIKSIHVASALVSISGFIIRGLWMMNNSARLQQKWVKIVPHIVDTVLLVSAIVLAVQIQQYPFVHGWLTAKVLALLAYIGFGTVALKRGKNKTIRSLAFFSAIIVFVYIALVARSHNAFLM